MGKLGSKLVISCHQKGHFEPGAELISVELLPRESHANHKTTQAVAKTMNGSLQNDRGVTLLNVLPTQFIEHEEVTLVPTWSLQGCSICATYYPSTLGCQKRNETPTQPQNLWPTICFPCKIW